MKVLKVATHWTSAEAAQIYESLDLLKTAIREATAVTLGKCEQATPTNKKTGKQFNDDIDF
jgi:hypothetical protein